MYRLMLLLVAFASTGATAAWSQGQAPRIDEYKMTTYQVVLVTRGPKWVAESPEVMPTVQAHRAYVDGLLRTGRVHVAGPFGGDGQLRGVYILSGTTDDAKRLAEGDPGVQAGRYAVEILSWMAPEGWFQKPPDVADTERLFFGFLVSGSKTAAASSEEQQALMRSHLDHLDGQAKQGKLVLAGPLVKAAPRRGLLAYRVPTMDEALDRASADPMVKAGRMKPELYEWTIPKGILK